MLIKPHNKNELFPTFNFIGEQEWDVKIRSILSEYGVSISSPIGEDKISEREQALGLIFPNSMRLFLSNFGSLDFDGIRIYSTNEIQRMHDIWFYSALNQEDQSRLIGMIGIADYTNSEDIFALEVTTGRCCLCSHFPARLTNWLNGFDDLVKIAIIDLSWSVYGWADEEIRFMANQIKKELFGIDF